MLRAAYSAIVLLSSSDRVAESYVAQVYYDPLIEAGDAFAGLTADPKQALVTGGKFSFRAVRSANPTLAPRLEDDFNRRDRLGSGSEISC